MIDIATERVVSLGDATKLLPKRRRGKKRHVSALYRWAKHGLRGVQLETIPVGGTLCTSMEALQRFFERLAEARQPRTEPTFAGPAARQRAAREAERELERLGI